MPLVKPIDISDKEVNDLRYVRPWKLLSLFGIVSIHSPPAVDHKDEDLRGEAAN